MGDDKPGGTPSTGAPPGVASLAYGAAAMVVVSVPV
jgi:hypothetical protein